MSIISQSKAYFWISMPIISQSKPYFWTSMPIISQSASYYWTSMPIINQSTAYYWTSMPIISRSTAYLGTSRSTCLVKKSIYGPQNWVGMIPKKTRAGKCCIFACFARRDLLYEIDSGRKLKQSQGSFLVYCALCVAYRSRGTTIITFASVRDYKTDFWPCDQSALESLHVY